ncbi:M20 family metallopeptidase [Streptomyces nigra]|uniref:M20 family metallopeptidase n=1 Tax=Streptomyces nigra TaxID=1827580 RepID=UPI00369CE9E9
MDFEGLLGARRRAAREELATAIRTLTSQHTLHSPAIETAAPDAFHEPRLYSQMVLGGLPAMTADQLLLAALPADGPPSTVRTDDEGTAYLPGLGRYTTGRAATELTVRRDPHTSDLTAEHDGTTYPLQPAAFVPGTRMELVDRLDPILRAFLDLHIDEPGKLTVLDGHHHLPAIERALDVIAAVSPGYHQALTESLRAVLLFRHPTAESFAALGMHGMIFLNVPEAPGTDYFIEELVHQGGHVLFSEATLNRGDFFLVDPEAPLSQIVGHDDPRTVYDFFHGLFTEHMEYQIVLATLDRDLAPTEERPSFTTHLRSVTARHLRDLQLIAPHADKVFSPAGHEILTAFQKAYEEAGSHPTLTHLHATTGTQATVTPNRTTAATPDAAELLRELIAIPSVNPLLPGAEGLHDERDVAAHIARRLREAGLEVQTQDVTDGRYNVIARLPRAGTADDQVILLSAHMDTYPAGGPRAAYTPIQENGRLHGRGSADAKGSLAAMMAAFLQAATEPDRREAYLAATIDEECLLQGARALATYGIRPTLAVTGEPTLLAPVVAQKGIIRGEILVHGPHTHAAYPAQTTAISAAAELITALGRLNLALRDRPGHPQLGHPTVTPTKVTSTGGMNLSATEVTVAFDARFLPGTSAEEFAAAIQADLRELLPARVDFTLRPPAFISPPNETAPATPLVSEFCAAVKSVTGTCEPQAFSYGSEAGVLAQFSQASLVFGPGDAACSHAETETIDLTQLTAATEILRSVLVGDPQ